MRYIEGQACILFCPPNSRSEAFIGREGLTIPHNTPTGCKPVVHGARNAPLSGSATAWQGDVSATFDFQLIDLGLKNQNMRFAKEVSPDDVATVTEPDTPNHPRLVFDVR